MNGIIKLNNVEINNETKETVSARDLHSFLESGRQFANWIKERITKYNFKENQDFALVKNSLNNFVKQDFDQYGGQNRIEYYLTLDMAKQLCMVENNEKGMQARKYFIDCEKKVKQSANNAHYVPQSYSEALLLAAQQAKETEQLKLENQALDQAVKILEPKADFCDKVSRSINAITIRDFAKVLGTGQNRLFDLLRRVGLLMIDNKPYQEYVDRGCFRMVEKERKDQSGEVQTYTQTLITGKGQIYIQQKYFPKQIH